jgi:hypothetical protein
MPYEIYNRKVVRRGSPSITATKLGRLAINKTASQFLEKNAVEFVLLLWDAENRKIGIRPIGKKDPRSYNVVYGNKGNGAGFSAKTFLDYIGLDYSISRVLQATWNGDQEILEADVPVEYLSGKTQQKLIEMEVQPKRSSVK